MTLTIDLPVKKDTKLYQCDICNKARTTAEQLRSHIYEVHDKKKRHQCTRCDFKSYRKDTVDKHFKAIHLKIKDWKCEICSQEFADKRHLRNHMIKVHEENKDAMKTFACDVCDYKTIYKIGLKKHLNIHSNLKQFECNICDYKTNYDRNLKLHKDSVHLGLKPYECDKCEKTFTQNTHMKTHKNRVHNENPMICDHCTETFSERKLLDRHKAIKHQIGEVNRYKCDQCEYTTIHAIVFKDHVKNQHGIRHYKCTTCAKAFGTETSLKSHQIVHNEARFHCRLCQLTFKHPRSLKKHQNRVPEQCDICSIKFCTTQEKAKHCKVVHLDEQPFKCKSCPKQFAKLSDFELHSVSEHSEGENSVKILECDQCDYKALGKMAKYRLKKHSFVHKEKPHPCEDCGKRFISSYDIEAHRKSHLGIKEYTCEQCDQAFAFKHSLKNHQQRVHSSVELGIRPHKCDICEKTFATIAQKRGHFRAAHVPKDSFQCEYCDKIFSVKRTLREHKVLYHSDKENNGELYNCDVCEFKTASKQTLKYHGYQHMDKTDRPHPCEHCDKRYVQKALLQRHIKTIHLGIKEFRCEL